MDLLSKRGLIIPLAVTIILFILIFPPSSAQENNLHIAFHPECGDNDAYQIGGQLKEKISGNVKEFKMRDKAKCEYKEDTNVPKEFPFWTGKSKKNYVTISLEKGGSNNVYFIKGNDYGRKLAGKLVKNFRNNDLPVGFKSVQCPGFMNLCENYYGGSPVSVNVKIDIDKSNKNKVLKAFRESFISEKLGTKCSDESNCKGSIFAGKLNCNPVADSFKEYEKACCPGNKRWNGTDCVSVETDLFFGETDLHITFHPQCGDKLSMEVGKKLKKELNPSLKEFKLRENIGCDYREKSQIPDAFPFWKNKPRKDHLTISLKRNSDNSIIYTPKEKEFGSKYGSLLASNIKEEFKKIGFDVQLKEETEEDSDVWRNDLYGGTAVSLHLNFDQKDKEKLVRGLRKAILSYYEERTGRDLLPDKTVFLVSDENWRQVLPLVPVTTWKDSSGKVEECPTLIYHKEGQSFDPVSVIKFLDEYNPDKVVTVGDIPTDFATLLIKSDKTNLKEGDIERIHKADVSKLIEEPSNVVYVENNYEKALMASVYASLIHSPLLIDDNSNLGIMKGMNVVCVGDVDQKNRCDESYSLKELRRKYLHETNTDKLVLVNPRDLELNIEEEFVPSEPIASGQSFKKLFGKTSLAAPFLAAAKQELIISTESSNYLEVDEFVDNVIDELEMKPKFLTIMASPIAIQMSVPIHDDIQKEVDNSYYGELDGPRGKPSKNVGGYNPKTKVDLAVGRIFGITMSDVSVNVARSIFYEDLDSSESALSMIFDRHEIDESKYKEFTRQHYFGNSIRSKFKKTSEYGHYELQDPPKSLLRRIYSDFSNNKLFIYNDHATYSYWATLKRYDLAKLGYSDYPEVKPNIILNEACETCAFADMRKYKFKYISKAFPTKKPKMKNLDLQETPLTIELGKIGNWYYGGSEKTHLEISSNGEEWQDCGTFKHKEYPSYNLTFDCGTFTGKELYLNVTVTNLQKEGHSPDYFHSIKLFNSNTDRLIEKKVGNEKYKNWYYLHNLLCTKMLRRGTVVFLGATDISRGNGRELSYFTRGMILENRPIGECLKDMRNGYKWFSNTLILLGDPTFGGDIYLREK